MLRSGYNAGHLTDSRSTTLQLRNIGDKLVQLYVYKNSQKNEFYERTEGLLKLLIDQ